ncbi:MAG: 23S rRNA (guanosine(2251)-2'-O)-methyltransferase RlmB [Deltaproteobacteria bacterium]|nr:MAG: 23S rRNA (guanosine(2251)-2'-O)-methyltransferase RlmB [Deltaproteobacteria bacterium]
MKRIIAGRRAVAEALRGQGEVSVVYAEEPEDRALSELRDLAQKSKVRIEESTRGALDALTEGVRHQGVVAITGAYPYRDLHQLLQEAGDAPLFVALDQVTDPHNFGAIVRSAVAFGARGVITTKDRCAPVTPVVVRASAGATEHLPIARVTNLARALGTLTDDGFEVIGLAGEATTTLGDLGRQGADGAGRVIVIGSEGKGLRRLTRRACAHLVRIEMGDTIGSLNASVAAGIALYALGKSSDG